jgi:thiol-disulfide isomerase/thioredoxin
VISTTFALAVGLAQAGDAEQRVVEYLRGHLTPGQPVSVSRLYNEVFTQPEERAVLDRLFNTFFKIPLFAAQFREAEGRPPSLDELSEQFGLPVPGESRVLLDVMETDPRMPRFLTRDAETGEILEVDVEAIRGHPRFGKMLERSLGGLVGAPAPGLSLPGPDGTPVTTEALAGSPYVVYFWFTGCPPCLETSPRLVALHEKYASRGLEVVAPNADRILELPYTDAQREAYLKKLGARFRVGHLTEEAQAAFGAISVFPTLFFVSRDGLVVEQKVNAQSQQELEAAILKALE